MPTLAECEDLLSRYAGANNDFTERLNMVCARLLPAGNFLGSKVKLNLNAYTDVDGNSVITLPRGYTTALGGVYHACDSYGMPLQVRSPWYEFAPEGAGLYDGSRCGNDIVPLEGRFTVFRDWNTAMRLRVKTETPETSAKIYFRGTLEGDTIYSQDGVNWIEGVALTYEDGDYTTSQTFDRPPYRVIKLATLGRLLLYAVDSDDVEYLVGVYEPGETNPKFRRYKVPTPSEDILSSSEDIIILSQHYTKDEIDAMFGGLTNITVSSAVGSPQDVAPAHPFVQYFQRIIAQAGSGAYTHKFTVDTARAMEGAIFRILVEIAASANPTIEVYNESAAGTLLQTLSGDLSNAGSFLLELEMVSGSWQKISGVYLT